MLLSFFQIGSLVDHYLFEHHNIAKRSTQPNHEHHKYLQDEQNVSCFYPQAARDGLCWSLK